MYLLKHRIELSRAFLVTLPSESAVTHLSWIQFGYFPSRCPASPSGALDSVTRSRAEDPQNRGNIRLDCSVCTLDRAESCRYGTTTPRYV